MSSESSQSACSITNYSVCAWIHVVGLKSLTFNMSETRLYSKLKGLDEKVKNMKKKKTSEAVELYQSFMQSSFNIVLGSNNTHSHSNSQKEVRLCKRIAETNTENKLLKKKVVKLKKQVEKGIATSINYDIAVEKVDAAYMEVDELKTHAVEAKIENEQLRKSTEKVESNLKKINDEQYRK